MIAEAREEVAEWLRRCTANPLCSARVGSNPIPRRKNLFMSWTQKPFLILHILSIFLNRFLASPYELVPVTRWPSG